MKRVRLVWLLAGILSLSVFWGCQTPPEVMVIEKPVEVEVEKIVEKPVEVYIERPVRVDVPYPVPGPTEYMDRTVIVEKEVPVPMKEPSPRTPLVPLTQKIIRRVERNQLAINRFQYYISAAIVLEKEERKDNLTISETGEGWLEETVTLKQVEILPATKGVMKDSRDTVTYISAIGAVRDSRDTNGTISAIEVCFDENDTDKILTFKKDAAGDRFILDYDYAKGTIHYGGETYKLRMFTTKDDPYLLVRYYEKTLDAPDVRKLAGQPKSTAARSAVP